MQERRRAQAELEGGRERLGPQEVRELESGFKQRDMHARHGLDDVSARAGGRRGRSQRPARWCGLTVGCCAPRTQLHRRSCELTRRIMGAFLLVRPARALLDHPTGAQSAAPADACVLLPCLQCQKIMAQEIATKLDLVTKTLPLPCVFYYLRG